MTAATSTMRVRVLVVLSVVALIGAVFTASPAHAATCTTPTPSDGTATVTLTGPETVSMSNGSVIFGSGPACAADTQRIDVTGTTGAGALTFDLAPGAFETSDGIEIWFRLNLSGGTDAVVVNGTSQADRITMGTGGVNLDGTDDPEITDTSGDNITAAGVESWTVNGLAGNDVLVADGSSSGDEFPQAVILNGGEGSDPLVTGGDGADTINGDAGNDHLEGGNGNDTVNGNDGNDTFDADADPDGADAMDGGTGTDTADYSNRRSTNPVSVSLDDVAATPGNDGATSGELDDVVNMERAFGGDGADTLTAAAYTGTTAPNVTLFGGDGNDSMTGGDGNDQLLVRHVPGPLAEEFGRMLHEMRLGRSRGDSLRQLASRSDVEELRSFVLAMVQADQFGVSISRVLRAQAIELRTKRRQRAEEQAMKVPIKILFPLIFCILPVLFIFILGPAAIRIADNIIGL